MQTAQAMAGGDMVGSEGLPTYKVPLLGRFYGDAGSAASKQSAYYNTLDDVRRHAAEVKGLRNDRRGAEAAAYLRKHPQASMHFAANMAENQVKKLRDRRRDLQKQGAPREQIRMVERQMTQVMEQFAQRVKAREAV